MDSCFGRNDNEDRLIVGGRIFKGGFFVGGKPREGQPGEQEGVGEGGYDIPADFGAEFIGEGRGQFDESLGDLGSVDRIAVSDGAVDEVDANGAENKGSEGEEGNFVRPFGLGFFETEDDEGEVGG